MSNDGTGSILTASGLLRDPTATAVNIPVYNPAKIPSSSGESLPPAGKGSSGSGASGNGASGNGASGSGAIAVAAAAGALAAKPAATPPATRTASPQTLVDQLNKYLNDSGRADEYRVDPGSSGKLIQQINPANGEVIGEFSVDEFPSLARGLGASGLLINSRA
jgi:hypothetical protein